MLTVPASLSDAFEAQLSQRNIPDQQRRDFHKWLGFIRVFDLLTAEHDAKLEQVAILHEQDSAANTVGVFLIFITF